MPDLPHPPKNSSARLLRHVTALAGQDHTNREPAYFLTNRAQRAYFVIQAAICWTTFDSTPLNPW